jgi:hypothetical protein
MQSNTHLVFNGCVKEEELSSLWCLLRADLASLVSFLVLVSAPVANAVSMPSAVSTHNHLNKLDAISDLDRQMGQITPVSELSNINLDSWAFQALQNLATKYGCVNSLVNGAYQGSQTLTRYQFAAGLNACITQINQQITSNQFVALDSETLAIIERLQSEFAAELATVQGQVDLLEAKVETLNSQQFSPHAELEGEVIFALTGVAGAENADDDDEDIDESLVLSHRVRLSFVSSFTGKDQLQVRLQARNTPELEDVTGTKMANLGFDGDSDGEFEIDEVEYQFPVGEQANVTLFALGGGLGDLVPSVNPLFSGSEDGSISTFGRENPMRRQGGGAGIGISYQLSKATQLSLGYITSNPMNPETGIFASPYGAIAQLTIEPTETTALSLTYAHSYNNLNTGTGSELSRDPFDDEADAIIANSVGVEAAWQLSPTITLGGRAGLISAQAKDLPSNPVADIWTWSVLLSITDVMEDDSFAGLVFGQPPKVTKNSFGREFVDKDTSLHLEAFYHLQLTDNLAITPGLFVIFNPEHNQEKNSIYVGTIRTTFSF